MFWIFVGIMIIIATIVVEFVRYCIYKKNLKKYNNILHNLLDKEYSIYVEEHVKFDIPYDDFEKYAVYHMQSVKKDCPQYNFNLMVVLAIIVFGLCLIGIGTLNYLYL